MINAFLGLDTSNYRTSICVLDEQGKIIFEKKELLPVPLGEKGLQQSEALFHHINRLPQLFSDLPPHLNWLSVAASTRPRPVDSSYMPVFLSGESFGKSVASLLAIPFYETSHQEGHIAAAEHSLNFPIKNKEFLAVHLSGGTSELLKVTRTDTGYFITCLGGSLDLHAGQLIDRIGVMMGLPFPAGPQLERLALEAEGTMRVPSYVRDYNFSFSGPETALINLLNDHKSHNEIARAAEQVIANTMEKVIRKAVFETQLYDVLIVGGVAANKYIQSRLKKRLEHPAVKAKCYFTSPAYSGDNALGVASLALKNFNLSKRRTL